MTRTTLLAAALLLGGCASTSGTWTPPDEAPLPAGFPAPDEPGAIVVKEYPATRGAWTTHMGELDDGTWAAFWPLFTHIKSNDIAMSAPVVAAYPEAVGEADDGLMQVGFLYGDPSRTPDSVDNPVRVSDAPPVTVVSIGVIGPYDVTVMRPALERLRTWLDLNADRWVASGEPRRLFYQNPSFWKGRLYSEVQIPIAPAGADRSATDVARGQERRTR